jgi:hypothetical protein
MSNGEKPLLVRRAKVGSVDLYEIKDSELETLASGSPATLELTFGIALLSIAFTTLGTIVSTEKFKNDTIRLIFILSTIVGFILSPYFIARWFLAKSSINKLVFQIKSRMPPPEPTIPPAQTPGAPSTHGPDSPVG